MKFGETAGCASTIISWGRNPRGDRKNEQSRGRGSNDDVSSDRALHSLKKSLEKGRREASFISVDSFYRRRSVEPDDEFSFICFHPVSERHTFPFRRLPEMFLRDLSHETVPNSSLHIRFSHRRNIEICPCFYVLFRLYGNIMAT